MNWASNEGHMHIVKLMIEKSATNFDDTMRWAAEGGHMDIVNYLKSLQ